MWIRNYNLHTNGRSHIRVNERRLDHCARLGICANINDEKIKSKDKEGGQKIYFYCCLLYPRWNNLFALCLGGPAEPDFEFFCLPCDILTSLPVFYSSAQPWWITLLNAQFKVTKFLTLREEYSQTCLEGERHFEASAMLLALEELRFWSCSLWGASNYSTLVER